MFTRKQTILLILAAIALDVLLVSQVCKADETVNTYDPSTGTYETTTVQPTTYGYEATTYSHATGTYTHTTATANGDGSYSATTLPLTARPSTPARTNR
jgi:hypothetical protein